MHTSAIIRLFKQGICLTTFLSFICSTLWVSNSTPLFILAVCGGLSFILPQRTRFSFATWLFIAFFVYNVLCDSFLFPDTTGFVMYRRMLLAFCGGIAVWYALRTQKTDFMLLLSLAFTLTSAGIMLWAAFFGHWESLFMGGERLFLLQSHPNGLASICSVVALSSLTQLLYGGPSATADNTASPAVSPDVGHNTSSAFTSEPVFRLYRRIVENRFFLAASAALAFICLFLTLSRTSFFITLAISLCLVAGRVLPLLKKTKRRLIAPAAITAAAAVALLLFSQPHIFANHRMSKILVNGPWNDSTFASRMPGWESAWHSFLDHPIFGNGPESFDRTHAVYVANNYTRLVATLGEETVTGDTVILPHAHNMYLMFLSESGLIGTALALLLLTAPLACACRNRTLYGVTVPVLSYFLLAGMMEVPFYGSKAAAFNIGTVFLLLGYFSAMIGESRRPSQRTTGSTCISA